MLMHTDVKREPFLMPGPSFSVGISSNCCIPFNSCTGMKRMSRFPYIVHKLFVPWIFLDKFCKPPPCGRVDVFFAAKDDCRCCIYNESVPYHCLSSSDQLRLCTYVGNKCPPPDVPLPVVLGLTSWLVPIQREPCLVFQL